VAGVIDFEKVGRKLPVNDIVKLVNPDPVSKEGTVSGNIDILDVRFGNLWTNISRELFVQSGVKYGDLLEVTIENNERLVYKNAMTFGKSFADSRLGEPLIYVNSVDKLGVAINQGSFAKAYHIGTGISWKISIRKKETTIQIDKEI